MKFIPQLDSMDCGIACLCMIADHYGCKSDADFIRQLSINLSEESLC